MKNKKKGSGGLFSKSQQPQQPQQFRFDMFELPVDVRREIVEEQDYERQKFLNKTLDKNEKEIDKILKKIDKNEIELEKKMSFNHHSLSRQQQNNLYIQMYKSNIKKLEKKYFELEDDYDKYYKELDAIETKMRIRAELVPWPEKPPSPLRSYYSTRSHTKKAYYNTRSKSKASQSRSTQIKKTIKKKSKKKSKKTIKK